MKCPNPECGFELADDYNGVICDECGKDLYRCTVCNKLTTKQPKCEFCGEDVVENGPAAGAAPVQTAAVHNVMQQAAPIQPPIQNAPVQNAQAHARTEMMSAGGGGRLFLRHSGENWTLEIANGDILGRESGNHVSRLGNYKYISGTHAQITLTQNGWCITDQKSSNKTYVNGQVLQPHVQTPIKSNDTITLADQKFSVLVIN